MVASILQEQPKVITPALRNYPRQAYALGDLLAGQLPAP